MSHPSFHTLAAVAPCQAVFAGEYHSLWLACINGASSVKVRDAGTMEVQPLTDIPVAALQSAFDAALAGSEHIGLDSPDGAFRLSRLALLDGYEYCLTHGAPVAGRATADAQLAA